MDMSIRAPRSDEAGDAAEYLHLVSAIEHYSRLKNMIRGTFEHQWSDTTVIHVLNTFLQDAIMDMSIRAPRADEAVDAAEYLHLVSAIQCYERSKVYAQWQTQPW